MSEMFWGMDEDAGEEPVTEEVESCEEQQEEKETSGMLELLQTHHKSSIPVHRLALARKLPQLLDQITPREILEDVPHILTTMTKDAESSVRHALCEQFVEIARVFKIKCGADGVLKVLRNVVPLVERMLTDETATVREIALVAIVGIAREVDIQQLEEYILPVVSSLANEVDEEEYRVEAAQLINDLAPLMPQELVLSFSLDLVRKFTQDTQFRVRKGMASNINLLCEALGVDNTSELLLPLYFELSEDEVWGVRKACVDSLVSFSKFVTAEKRLEVLVPVFERLADDASRWVKSSVLQSLGPFIATFGTSPIPHVLLEHYKKMADSKTSSIYSENENTFHCAYNFPAVLSAVGPEGWPELSDTYQILLRDSNSKVRQSLAFSLHAVAAVLGEKLSEQVLLATFEEFLTDLDDVKVGVITNMAKFLEILSLPVRRQYLGELKKLCLGKSGSGSGSGSGESDSDDCLFFRTPDPPGSTRTNTTMWRHRRLLSKQMGALALLYDATTVVESILPLFKSLVNDPVASVRNALKTQLGAIVRSLAELPDKQHELLEFIQSMSEPTAPYHHRIWFCKAVVHAAKDISPELYETYIAPGIDLLLVDPIPNVRVSITNSVINISKLEASALLSYSAEIGDVSPEGALPEEAKELNGQETKN
eukprot:TRINITY_DN1091_c2_g2_i1.p1 TRINITY_DN1091_c2_g2~~TRINITY_DN1091_c2_g2_i1.p1  ORF type:complete len:655 (-),score=148.30 TRINITY_DN1091_c2_g2_i1:80-2044(-)